MGQSFAGTRVENTVAVDPSRQSVNHNSV